MVGIPWEGALAVAGERQKFERMIDELGYKFAEGFKYPEFGNNRYRFAVVDKRIGHPSEEGIYWAFPTYAYQPAAKKKKSR